MSKVRFVITERLRGQTDLQAKWRFDDQGHRLMVRFRPNLSPGDPVTVRLQTPGGATALVHGVISLSIAPCEAPGFSEVALDDASKSRLLELNEDPRLVAADIRRASRRRRLEIWSDCRRSRDAATRTARLLDISPTGVFMASGLNPKAGDTVLFRPTPSMTWLAGAVRWSGRKFGERGVGVKLVFSRRSERQSWHDWYVGADALTASNP